MQALEGWFEYQHRLEKNHIVLAINSISLINTLLEDTIDIASFSRQKSKESLKTKGPPDLIMTIFDHSVSPSKT